MAIKALIDSKKPLIGHNCMYDWLYVYNQFVDKLPETYAEFIKDWNEKFPHTFDNKVLAFQSKSFYRTSLGEVYDKCSNDDKFKHNLKFKFDSKNKFTSYEGTELLSHYHEAAYDAHMTGMAFAHVLKIKEIDEVKQAFFKKNGKQKGPSSEMNEAVNALKNKQVDLNGKYP